VLASAVCMDKLMFKELLRNAGVRQADYRAVHAEQFRSDRDAVIERLAPLGFPAFVSSGPAHRQEVKRAVQRRFGLQDEVARGDRRRKAIIERARDA